MNIVGVAKTDIFSTCVFNNIVGVASFFNSLFSLRSRLRIQLKHSLSYTYIFWNFFGSAPNYLLFLIHRGLPRFVKALKGFHRVEGLGGSRRRRHILTRHFDVLERQAVTHVLGAPHLPKRFAHLLDPMALSTPSWLQARRCTQCLSDTE